MDWTELPWGFWMWLGSILGVAAVAVTLGLIGDWLTGWWTINRLRNRLDAKRRLRREGRPPRETVATWWVVTCEHCDFRYDAMTEQDASNHLEKHRRATNHWVGQRQLDSRDM
jgi:hypothetical protein